MQAMLVTCNPQILIRRTICNKEEIRSGFLDDPTDFLIVFRLGRTRECSSDDESWISDLQTPSCFPGDSRRSS